VHRCWSNLPRVIRSTRFDRSKMQRSLELIIDYSAQQKLIPRAFSVDELFDDVTRTLR